MRRINSIFVYSLILIFLNTVPLYGGWFPWSTPTLVSVGGEDYSVEDFKVWWRHWQEKDTQLPERPLPFVDWILLFKEAERMKLYEFPEYQKKIHTFLKARTLMLLKAEEIDGKIEINDDDLWKQYLKTHTPRYQLNIFLFQEEEAAQAFVDKFGTKSVTDEVFNSSYGRDDGYISQSTEWYRPLAINVGWHPILDELEEGEISPPVTWKKDFVVLRLKDVKEGDPDDFGTVKKQLYQTAWKAEESRLTIDLLTRLRQQYHVKIDNERLEKLDIESKDEALLNEAIIYTDNGNISEKIILAKIHQILRFRRQNGFKAEPSLSFKNQVVNGIVDQTLTSWEAMARKYEHKPPFETVYQFYCQHRMIKQIENRLFASQVKVEDKEIEAYYNKNKALYTTQEVVRMAITEGSTEELEALWLEVALGGDFRVLAGQRRGHEVPIREIPINHLNPKVKEVLDKLTENEVSKVFSVDDHVSLVQLIERKKAETIPLSKVSKNIKQTLHADKLAMFRQNYLAKLRVENAVVIDDAEWQKLREELEQHGDTK